MIYLVILIYDVGCNLIKLRILRKGEMKNGR